MLLIEYKPKCNIVHVISWCFKQTEYFQIFPANSWSHLISTLPKQQPELLAQCNSSTHYFRIHSIKNSYTYKIWNALGGWRLLENHRIPCGTAICCVVRHVFFANCEHTKYWYCLRLMAFLRLSKAVPKSPAGPCLENILRNLQCLQPWTKTSTNPKTTLKE